jgi:lambda family phage portal protein
MGIKDFFPRTASVMSSPKETADSSSYFGSGGTFNRQFYGQKWAGGLSNPNPSLTIDHQRMRNQARVITQTSQQAGALVNRDVDTVIDSGLVLSSEPRYELLGITAEEAERWGNARGIEFDLWAQDKRSCRSGMYNFYQAQRLIYRYRKRDNECFVRMYYNFSDPTLLSPLQFEIIDPDQIRGNGYTQTNGLFLQNDGITRDSQGRELTYKIWTKDDTGMMVVSSEIPRTGPKSGRVFMTHGFDPEYCGQTRGFSSLGISVQELENLLDFSSAQIKKAINQSNIYMYGKQSDPNKYVDNPLKDIAQRAGPRPSSVFGSDPTDAPVDAVVTPFYQAVKEAPVGVPGSIGVFNMPGGQDLVPFTNTAPSDSYDKFVDSYFAYIAACQGESIETVLMRFSSNYSASRATLILVWRIAVQHRYQIATDHFDPIYEQIVSLGIASGRVSAPGFSDPYLRAAWLCHTWSGSSMPNIDPGKMITADKTAAELGAITLDKVAENYSGSNGASNRAKLRREYSELPPAPWGTNSGAVQQTDGSDDAGGQDDN